MTEKQDDGYRLKPKQIWYVKLPAVTCVMKLIVTDISAYTVELSDSLLSVGDRYKISDVEFVELLGYVNG